MLATLSHPPAKTLRLFSLGRLNGPLGEDIADHLVDCPDCAALLLNAPDDTLVGLLRGAGTTPAEPTHPPAWLVGHPRYRPIRELGRGGMGDVWLVEHRHLERPVALKAIRPELTAHPDAADRLRREARAVARLRHPHVVQAFDAEEVDGTHFLVMEYVEGVTLKQWLDSHGPLPVPEACEFIRQAALGLQAAHENGLVHRDVKPHNLMVTTGEAGPTVKVLDFGLATLTEPGFREGLTATQVIMGTPDYMSPEQARDSRSADARSDVYSLGCTLFTLLSGRPPFDGSTAIDKLIAHRQTPPPLHLLPTSVRKLVGRMLAKEPARRLASAADVARSLEPFARGETPKPPSRWPFAVGLAAMFLVALFAGIILRVQTDRGEAVIRTDDPNLQIEIKGDKVVRIVDPKSGKVYAVDLQGQSVGLLDDPDGLQVDIVGKGPVVLKRKGAHVATVEWLPKAAEAGTTGDKPAITRDATPPPLLERIWQHSLRIAAIPDSLAFSPDGKLLLVGSDTGVLFLKTDTGELQPDRIKDVQRAFFTPDGKTLIGHGAEHLHWFDVASGKGLRSEKVGKIANLRLSPIGRLALLEFVDGGQEVWNVEGSNRVGWGVRGRPLAFLPDGRKMLLVGKPDEPGSIAEVGGGVEPWFGLPSKGYFAGSFPPDSHVFIVREGGKLRVLDAVPILGPGLRVELPREIQVVDLGPKVDDAAWRMAAVSRDGKRFAVRDSQGAIRVWDLSTGHELASTMGVDTISLDEAFRRTLTKRDEVSRPPLPPVRSLAFSPDGRVLVAVCEDGNVHAFRVAEPGKAAGEKPAKPADIRLLWEAEHSRGKVRRLAISPDGRLVASVSEDGRCEMRDATNGKVTWLVEDRSSPVFFPDGKRLLLAGGGWLYITNAETGKVMRKIGEHGETVERCEVSADGQYALSAAEGVVYLWDIESGRRIGRWADGVKPAFLLPETGQLLAVDQPGKLPAVWSFDVNGVVDRPTRPGGHPAPMPANTLFEGSFPAQSKWVFSRAAEGKVLVFDRSTGKEVRRLDVGLADGEVPAISPDGRLLLSHNRKNQVRLWDVKSGAEIGGVDRDGSRPEGIAAWAISADGRTAVSANGSRTIYLWRLP